jgi:anti-sigma factor RsiW
VTLGSDRPSWQALNAYVDGALAPAETRHVEAAAAADPAVAAALAELGRAKRATAALLELGLAGAPAAPALQPERPRRAGTRKHLWAAAAALLLVVAALALWRSGSSGDETAAWLAQAQSRYHAQLASAAPAEPALLPAVLVGQAPVFDLGLAGLSLVETESRDGAVYLGYQGSRGCRLGLWIAAAPAGLEAELRESLHEGLLLATWRQGQLGYALLSQDMDPRRFTGIARLLVARTSAEIEMALDAEALTLPCLG